MYYSVLWRHSSNASAAWSWLLSPCRIKEDSAASSLSKFLIEYMLKSLSKGQDFLKSKYKKTFQWDSSRNSSIIHRVRVIPTKTMMFSEDLDTFCHVNNGLVMDTIKELLFER